MSSSQSAPILTADKAGAGRLMLRPRRAADAEALFPTMADPSIMRWWSRPAFEHIEQLRENFASDGQSAWRSWVIVPAGSDQAIGFVSAGWKREGVVEIGYLLARQAQGRGYARNAVSMLIDHLFEKGNRRVFADTDPENHASIALLSALGFSREGHLRAEWHTHIGIRDSLIFGLLAEEWSLRNTR
ncbi:GNAT family N-acetyltransferase [Stenotrophomonas maltophilia]